LVWQEEQSIGQAGQLPPLLLEELDELLELLLCCASMFPINCAESNIIVLLKRKK